MRGLKYGSSSDSKALIKLNNLCQEADDPSGCYQNVRDATAFGPDTVDTLVQLYRNSFLTLSYTTTYQIPGNQVKFPNTWKGTFPGIWEFSLVSILAFDCDLAIDLTVIFDLFGILIFREYIFLKVKQGRMLIVEGKILEVKWSSLVD